MIKLYKFLTITGVFPSAQTNVHVRVCSPFRPKKVVASKFKYCDLIGLLNDQSSWSTFSGPKRVEMIPRTDTNIFGTYCQTRTEHQQPEYVRVWFRLNPYSNMSAVNQITRFKTIQVRPPDNRRMRRMHPRTCELKLSRPKEIYFGLRRKWFLIIQVLISWIIWPRLWPRFTAIHRENTVSYSTFRRFKFG